MTVNGKTTGITSEDLLTAGTKMGIKEKKCKDIIREIGTVVNAFDTFAELAGIRENTMADIKSVIAENRVDI